MELKEIKPVLESAFKPYRCVVKLKDYEEYINFKICDKNGKQIISVTEFNPKDNNELSSKIKECKDKIIDMGFKFD